MCVYANASHETNKQKKLGNPERSGEISWRENKEIYVAEQKRENLGREKKSVGGAAITGRESRREGHVRTKYNGMHG